MNLKTSSLHRHPRRQKHQLRQEISETLFSKIGNNHPLHDFPAILDLIALTVWFKLQFDYIPPFKNVFLAATIVGAIIVACDVLSGSVRLHHLFIPSIFYMLSRTSRDSANFKAVSMLVTVFSMPFTIGYTAFSVILGVYYSQTILWLSVFLFFVWMNLRLKL